MHFFMAIPDPPTVTAQERQVRVVRGKPIFYEPERVKNARILLMDYLAVNAPVEEFDGPLSLSVIWLFPKGKTHKHGEWRVTKPDTDNLEKMLKDCMTRTGFWHDDAQVVREVVEKRWSDDPTGIYIEIKELSNEG